jgi:molybdopterin synthase catalytic subunit
VGDVLILLTKETLEPQKITESVRQTSNGAIITFLGTTRGISLGRPVLHLEYEAYVEMAKRELEKIVRAVHQKWGIKEISIGHRFGKVEIGDISLVVAIGSVHRAEGFAACQYIVDQIKETVPIWKKEVFKDSEIWIDKNHPSTP